MADVLYLRQSDRCRELSNQFMRSLKRNRRWWNEYSENVGDDLETVPYHPNMNISESEYQEMIRLCKERILTKVTRQTIGILDQGDGRFRVTCRGYDQELRNLVFDLKNDIVDSPHGVLTNRGEVNGSDLSADEIGSWTGRLWKLEKSDETRGSRKIAEVAVGRREQDGLVVLFFRMNQFEPSRRPFKVNLVLLYDDSWAP
jgi:hypothetical protein